MYYIISFLKFLTNIPPIIVTKTIIPKFSSFPLLWVYKKCSTFLQLLDCSFLRTGIILNCPIKIVCYFLQL